MEPEISDIFQLKLVVKNGAMDSRGTHFMYMCVKVRFTSMKQYSKTH